MTALLIVFVLNGVLVVWSRQRREASYKSTFTFTFRRGHPPPTILRVVKLDASIFLMV